MIPLEEMESLTSVRAFPQLFNWLFMHPTGKAAPPMGAGDKMKALQSVFMALPVGQSSAFQ